MRASFTLLVVAVTSLLAAVTEFDLHGRRSARRLPWAPRLSRRGCNASDRRVGDADATSGLRGNAATVPSAASRRTLYEKD